MGGGGRRTDEVGREEATTKEEGLCYQGRRTALFLNKHPPALGVEICSLGIRQKDGWSGRRFKDRLYV